MSNPDFCEIHKNNVAVFKCSKCSRSVCSNCTVSASSFCPKCRGVNVLKVEKKHSKNEIRNILIAGFLMCLVSILVNTLSDNAERITNEKLITNSFIFFALGISFASAIYFVRKTDAFDDFKDIPLFGKTILKYLVYFTSIVGIPIIYFLYLVYKFFKKDGGNSKQVKTKSIIKSNR